MATDLHPPAACAECGHRGRAGLPCLPCWARVDARATAERIWAEEGYDIPRKPAPAPHNQEGDGD